MVLGNRCCDRRCGAVSGRAIALWRAERTHDGSAHVVRGALNGARALSILEKPATLRRSAASTGAPCGAGARWRALAAGRLLDVLFAGDPHGEHEGHRQDLPMTLELPPGFVEPWLGEHHSELHVRMGGALLERVAVNEDRAILTDDHQVSH